jgi:hypothetical protein
MEKKGEILNQLAIISDLLENANIESKSSTIIIELNKVEFEKTFEIVKKKYSKKIDTPEDTFTIAIGNVDIVFNMSNV